MKAILIAATALLLGTGAVIAQGLKVQPTASTSTTANAPSGIEVPGCTYTRHRFDLPAGGQPLCNKKSIEQIRHETRYEAVNSIGGAETSK